MFIGLGSLKFMFEEVHRICIFNQTTLQLNLGKYIDVINYYAFVANCSSLINCPSLIEILEQLSPFLCVYVIHVHS